MCMRLYFYQLCILYCKLAGEEKAFCDNSIVTRKYNPWILCPCKSLFEQFRRFANIYFLIMTILMFIGQNTLLFENAIEPNTTLLALIFTLGLTGFLHLRDDIKRHKKDKETNNRLNIQARRVQHYF